MDRYLYQLVCFSTLICLTFAGRRTCYECAITGSVSDPNGMKCNSPNPNPEFVTTCRASKPHCLKITGLVNGTETGKKMCAESNWAKIIGGKDKCIPSQDIPDFGFSLDSQEVELTDGLVCICDENECNGNQKLTPSQIAGICSILFITFLRIL